MLYTMCSRGGTGRRKGLKIRALFLEYWQKPQCSSVFRMSLSETNAIINYSNRPNFVAGGL
jgi:hypothetical protein